MHKPQGENWVMTKLGFAGEPQRQVLAIIVSFNGEELIEACLDSIIESAMKCDIMVVDNASADGTRKKLEAYNISVHYSKHNLGFGRANNIGLARALGAGYRYVLLLNQDARLFPDTIEKLFNSLEADRSADVASPLHVTRDGKTLDQNFSYNLEASGYTPDGILRFNSGAPVLWPVRFVPAAIWLVRVKAIQVIGGFDPLFPHYGEDTDYCNRLHYHGRKIGVCSYGKAVHLREGGKTVSGTRTAKLIKAVIREYIGYIVIYKDINLPLFRCMIAAVAACMREVRNKCVAGKYDGCIISIAALLLCVCRMHAIARSRRQSRQVNRAAYIPAQ
jgi:GT2 family glycosyltransferase